MLNFSDPLVDESHVEEIPQPKQQKSTFNNGLLQAIIKEVVEKQDLIVRKSKKRDDSSMDPQRRALENLQLLESWDQQYPLLSSLDAQQLISIWPTLLDHAKICLAHIFADTMDQDAVGDPEKGMVELYDVVSLILQTLNHPKFHAARQSVEIVKMLHPILIYLDAEIPLAAKLQDKISQLCENWYLKDLPDNEQVVAQALLYLLMKTAGPLGTVNDVKRIYAIRSALNLMDWNCQTSRTLIQLVQFSYTSPLFLKSAEGKRLLSFCFGLGPEMIRLIHESIKSQIPSCSQEILKSYGEIYFKAWKGLGKAVVNNVMEDELTTMMIDNFDAPPRETIRSFIEEVCIQDLMHQAVMAQHRVEVVNPKTGRMMQCYMANRLRTLLESGFHSQKRQPGVDAMLERLYEPILWRNLGVANVQVRKNALLLLFSVFPLRNPDASPDDIELSEIQQWEAFRQLLMDPNPTIRAECVKGICNVLSRYWELLHPRMIQVFLGLIWDLCFDLASASVRQAALTGLNYLLEECVLCYDVVKDKLLELAPLLHDTAERVRMEFVEVLLKISKIKIIRFYDVVSIDELLYRLTIDSSAQVKKRLSRLLLPSYFPEHKEIGIQIERCQFMLESNVEAAREFFAWIPRLISDRNVVAAFAVSLYEFLHFALLDGKKPKTDDEEDELKDLASRHFEDFLEIVAIVLDGLIRGLNEAKESHLQLKESIELEICARPLKNLNELCHTERGRSAVMSIASHLRPDRARKQGIEELVQYNKPGDAHAVVTTMTSAGRQEELFEAIVKQLVQTEMGTNVRTVQEAQQKSRSQRTSAREGKRKKTSFAFDDDSVWADYCEFDVDGTDVFQVIECVLKDGSLREAFLGDAGRVGTLISTLHQAIPLLDEVLQEGPLDDVERRRKYHFLAKSVELATRFILHVVKEVEDMKEELMQSIYHPLLKVMQTSLRDQIIKEEEGVKSEKQGKKRKNEKQARIEAMQRVVKACLTSVVEPVALGFSSLEYRTMLIETTHELLKLQTNTEWLESFARVLHQVADVMEDGEQDLAQYTLDLLLLVHTKSGGDLKRRQNLKLLQPVFTTVIRGLVYQGRLQVIAEPLTHLSVHDQLSSVEDFDDLTRLPDLTRWVCSLFSKPKSLQDAFMEELVKHAEENLTGLGDEGEDDGEEVEVKSEKRSKPVGKRLLRSAPTKELNVENLKKREMLESKRVSVVKRVVHLYDWIVDQAKIKKVQIGGLALKEWIEKMEKSSSQTNDDIPLELNRYFAERRMVDLPRVELVNVEEEEEEKRADASILEV